MKLILILLGLIFALTLAGCYEKKVCCPADGGCSKDAATNTTDDATPLADGS